MRLPKVYTKPHQKANSKPLFSDLLMIWSTVWVRHLCLKKWVNQVTIALLSNCALLFCIRLLLHQFWSTKESGSGCDSSVLEVLIIHWLCGHLRVRKNMISTCIETLLWLQMHGPIVRKGQGARYEVSLKHWSFYGSLYSQNRCDVFDWKSLCIVYRQLKFKLCLMSHWQFRNDFLKLQKKWCDKLGRNSEC